MRQPEGFIQEGTERLVCRLKHYIYGLKQSPRCWNHALDSQLKEMQFKQTSNDPCLYIHYNQEETSVDVDDIILGGRSELN